MILLNNDLTINLVLLYKTNLTLDLISISPTI
jgi:hypothetical protein